MRIAVYTADGKAVIDLSTISIYNYLKKGILKWKTIRKIMLLTKIPTAQ